MRRPGAEVKRGGRRGRLGPLHYAALAGWLAFCGVLACAFWPEKSDSPGRVVRSTLSTRPGGWSPVPGEPIVMDSTLSQETPELDGLHEAVERLRPLQKPLPPPGPGVWLASHPEPGQSFREYLACRPTRARGRP